MKKRNKERRRKGKRKVGSSYEKNDHLIKHATRTKHCPSGGARRYDRNFAPPMPRLSSENRSRMQLESMDGVGGERSDHKRRFWENRKPVGYPVVCGHDMMNILGCVKLLSLNIELSNWSLEYLVLIRPLIKQLE
jgi:hypothetical protein